MAVSATYIRDMFWEASDAAYFRRMLFISQILEGGSDVDHFASNSRTLGKISIDTTVSVLVLLLRKSL